jgi:hypothetical protein
MVGVMVQSSRKSAGAVYGRGKSRAGGAREARAALCDEEDGEMTKSFQDRCIEWSGDKVIVAAMERADAMRQVEGCWSFAVRAGLFVVLRLRQSNFLLFPLNPHDLRFAVRLSTSSPADIHSLSSPHLGYQTGLVLVERISRTQASSA